MQKFSKNTILLCLLLIASQSVKVKSVPCFLDWFGDYSDDDDSSSEEKHPTAAPASGGQPISGNFSGTFVGAGAGTLNTNPSGSENQPAAIYPPVIVITLPSAINQSRNSSQQSALAPSPATPATTSSPGTTSPSEKTTTPSSG